MNNVDKLHHVDEVIYYYINQPVKIIKRYDQVHMVKVRYEETKNEIIVDLGAITSKPSREMSISINRLWRKGI